MTSSNQTGGQAKSSESGAEETVRRARHAADEAIDSAAKYAKGKTEQAEGIAMEAVDRAKHAGTGAADATRSLGSESVDFARRIVEQNPLASVGVAAAIGFLIGSMLRR